MTSSLTYGGTSIIVLLICAALGYLVYGGINGASAMIILCALYSLALLLSFIPFIGIGLQGFASLWIIWPWTQAVIGIGSTWLTTIMLIVALMVGLIFWVRMTTAITIAVMVAADRVAFPL